MMKTRLNFSTLSFIQSSPSANTTYHFDQLPSSQNQTLSDITISPDEVYKELTQLNPAKAAGADNLCPKILKYCAHALYIPIHHLFSECISQCNIPAEWRIHRITPVHKSGAKDQANNYRPISLLCIVSKILERLIYNKMYTHLSLRKSPPFSLVSCKEDLLSISYCYS